MQLLSHYCILASHFLWKCPVQILEIALYNYFLASFLLFLTADTLSCSLHFQHVEQPGT